MSKVLLDRFSRTNNSDTTVIWLSAFTRGPYLGRILRSTEKFHGFRMSAELVDFDWVLVRETSGFTRDGTYYGGVANLEVQEECRDLISSIVADNESKQRRTVLMGSSMGAYGAALFGLEFSIPVFCFSPHFDLQVARKMCGRAPWIDFCVDDLSPAARLHYLSRLQSQIAMSRNAKESAPMLVQVSKDDFGVYREQVLPFANYALKAGVHVYLDERDMGGHSGIHVSIPYLREAIVQVRDGQIDIEKLKSIPGRTRSFGDRTDHFLSKLEDGLGKLVKPTGL